MLSDPKLCVTAGKSRDSRSVPTLLEAAGCQSRKAESVLRVAEPLLQVALSARNASRRRAPTLGSRCMHFNPTLDNLTIRLFCPPIPTSTFPQLTDQPHSEITSHFPVITLKVYVHVPVKGYTDGGHTIVVSIPQGIMICVSMHTN